MSDFLDKLVKDELSKKNCPCLTGYHLVTQKPDIKEYVQEILEDHQINTYKDVISDQLGTHQAAAYGWKNVADAVRNQQVHQLWIDPRRKKEGYLAGDNMPYTYPARNTKQVAHLHYWLSWIALSQGSQVIPTTMVTEFSEQPVAASLYYG
jgi:hypothetical protein